MLKPTDLIPGREYTVINSRKGTFRMRVDRVAGEWIHGTVTAGVARAAMSYNVRDVGEEVTVRDCHTRFEEITGSSQERNEP